MTERNSPNNLGLPPEEAAEPAEETGAAAIFRNAARIARDSQSMSVVSPDEEKEEPITGTKPITPESSGTDDPLTATERARRTIAILEGEEVDSTTQFQTMKPSDATQALARPKPKRGQYAAVVTPHTEEESKPKEGGFLQKIKKILGGDTGEDDTESEAGK